MEIKICGLTTPEAVATATNAGASHLGFIFYPPSPRAITASRAAEIARVAGRGPTKVAVFVNPSDAEISTVVDTLAPDLLQLHGAETPERVAELKQQFGVPVMKVVRISQARDIKVADAYEGLADLMLFDAKPPNDGKGMLPGGNGLTFDWALLANRTGKGTWFLSGGLDADNVVEAVRISGARAVDVSSGLETSPGEKSLTKITAFLDAVKDLEIDQT